MTTHKIQWLNLPGYKGETWNPIVGCNKVSDGCKNCYAEKMARRLSVALGTKGAQPSESWIAYSDVISNGKWNGKTSLVKSALTKPATWKAPRVVFVCSMGDLFHETVSFETIDAIFSVMADCDRHIFIVLTKRPERMVEFVEWERRKRGWIWQPSENIWMGVTAENQEQVETRIPVLNKVKAAVKFVSIEPMLGPVNISLWLYTGFDEPPYDDVINWVICGGESGHHARPMHPDWVRRLRNDCSFANVPFFFKQWGEYKPFVYDSESIQPVKYKGNGATFWRNKSGELFEIIDTDGDYICAGGEDEQFAAGIQKTGKHRSGNLLDGVKHEEYPEINL